MKPQPYLFYSVVELIDGSGPFFLEKDDSFDGDFTALYHSTELILGAIAIKTIWYDFEKQTFLHSIIELDPMVVYGGMSLMLVMGGIAITWLASAEQIDVVVDDSSEPLSINNINPIWENEFKKLDFSYNSHREVYSREVIKVMKSTQLQMRKYTYRYNFMIRGDKDLELTSIKELMVDGSMQSIDEEAFLNYCERARPLKIELGWTVGEDDYSAYFFMQDSGQIGIFNRFFGIHTTTKSDFIFNIDVEASIYSLALFRQGLREPVVIPESAYELIVFKNKFEDYRSENYNQPRGAWIW